MIEEAGRQGVEDAADQVAHLAHAGQGEVALRLLRGLLGDGQDVLGCCCGVVETGPHLHPPRGQVQGHLNGRHGGGGGVLLLVPPGAIRTLMMMMMPVMVVVVMAMLGLMKVEGL